MNRALLIALVLVTLVLLMRRTQLNINQPTSCNYIYGCDNLPVWTFWQ